MQMAQRKRQHEREEASEQEGEDEEYSEEEGRNTSRRERRRSVRSIRRRHRSLMILEIGKGGQGTNPPHRRRRRHCRIPQW